MIHEDERRILESFPEAKLITAKDDCVLGNHYHKLKTEYFVALSGEIIIRKDCETIGQPMEIGKIEKVSPNQRHSFKMSKDAVMIGVCTHPYDHTDDYR